MGRTMTQRSQIISLFLVVASVVGCGGPADQRSGVGIIIGSVEPEGPPAGPRVDEPRDEPEAEVDGEQGQADPGADAPDAEPDPAPEPQPAPAAVPDVELVAPPEGALVVNPVTFQVSSQGVTSLRLSADGWPMGEGTPTDGAWELSYEFSGTGYERAILLEGLDASGDVIATDSTRLTVVAPERDWGEQYADDLVANAAAYLDEAWSQISEGTPCVAFFSVGLRNHPDPARRFPDIYAVVTEGPPTEACELQGRCSLEARGFSGPHFDAADLRKGDIAFTQDTAPFEGELWPNHTYVFVGWVTPGETDYAWVIDNRQEFGAPYVRNIAAPDDDGAAFTPFQYFMRAPFVAPPQ
jgi:hypothetical protein